MNVSLAAHQPNNTLVETLDNTYFMSVELYIKHSFQLNQIINLTLNPSAGYQVMLCRRFINCTVSINLLYPLDGSSVFLIHLCKILRLRKSENPNSYQNFWRFTPVEQVFFPQSYQNQDRVPSAVSSSSNRSRTRVLKKWGRMHWGRGTQVKPCWHSLVLQGTLVRNMWWMLWDRECVCLFMCVWGINSNTI